MCTVSRISTLAPDHHQPQANRGRYCVPVTAAPGREACFLYFHFSSKKKNLILVSTNTETLLFPMLNFLHFPNLHATPTPIIPLCIYPAHALFYPSLWSSTLPMLRSWNRLYIYSISTPLPPWQAVLCIFHLWGWMTYILSLAPCSHSSPLLRYVLMLSHWPQAAVVGVAARLN